MKLVILVLSHVEVRCNTITFIVTCGLGNFTFKTKTKPKPKTENGSNLYVFPCLKVI